MHYSIFLFALASASIDAAKAPNGHVVHQQAMFKAATVDGQPVPAEVAVAV